MYKQLRNPRFYILIMADAVMFAVSLLAAYCVRFAMNIPASAWDQMLTILPLAIAAKWLGFFMLGAYRGMWRYTSLCDMQRLLAASFASSLFLVTAITFINHFQGYPRSVFVADFVFTFFLCGSVRAAIRLYHARDMGLTPEKNTPAHRTRLLLIGAGNAADKMIREIQVNPHYEAVCCLDDDAAKHHRSLLGVPVRGPIENLATIAAQFDAHEVLICMPSAAGPRMRTIVKLCDATGIPFRTLPSLSSLIDGNVTINDIRPVKYEDLLGRPPVKQDTVEIGKTLTGKVVAVTGAGGSIGSELCRQICRFKPEALVLIEASELNLYQIEKDLRGEFAAPLFPAMGRVQDRPLMEKIFARYRPAVIFHAAACKHVPMVESNPWEGVWNNVVGSQTVMDVAEQFEVERFVLISTDKAVRPTNVMGATKRAAELLLQSRPAGKTRFMAVRFGNVVGSSGSVIPLFQRQIQAGGPVTVTDPEMTRFFMTIPEAAQLVLQAGSLGEGGEIFVLEMGTPVKIAEMARDLIRLSGKEPDVDIQITYTGLRPGEKRYEELITQGEGICETNHEKIMVLRNGHSAPNAEVLAGLGELLDATKAYQACQIKEALYRLIPEYKVGLSASTLCPCCDHAVVATERVKANADHAADATRA